MPDELEPLEWHTETRKVGDLVPYDFNPRQLTAEQHQKLTESLRRFNLVELPAINLDGTIIAGHQRTRIMVELGRAQEEIEVRVPNRELTQEEFKEYLIRSNKNTGQWDFDVLANAFEITELKDWGFSEQELGIGFDDPNDGGDGDGGSGGPKVCKCPACGFEFQQE